MEVEIGVLPSGHLHCFATEVDGALGNHTWKTTIAEAFDRGTAEGLFALVAANSVTGMPPSLAYWRGFAARYLGQRCQLSQAAPAQPEAIEPLTATDAESLLANAPPMRGGEYLSPRMLAETWAQLDDWVCAQIRFHEGLGRLLAERAPQWHQVGRVCFHLAENKQDMEYPFAFMATYAAELSGQGRALHQPLHRALQEYSGAGDKKALIHLLSPVQRASQSSALVRDLVETGDLYHPLAWTPAEAYEFLQEIPLYERSGVLVRLPDWWRKRARPRVEITIGDHAQKRFGTDSLLDFKLEIALGHERLGEAEWQELVQAGEGLVFLKGQWVEVDGERLAQALAHWKKVEAGVAKAGISFVDGMRLLAGASENLSDSDTEESQRQWSLVQPGQWLESILEELRTPQAAQGAKPGSMLKAALRPYQQVGVSWLWQMSRLGLGACLADDMGLGKTIQVISLLLVQKKHHAERPSLLVLPASLLANWKAELERFAPSLRARYIHASLSDKERIDAMATGEKASWAGVDLVLTTYGTLLRQPWLMDRNWQLLVLDEAQAIKNPAARQARAVKKLKATSRIALTGTPVENRLGDLWSLFDFLCPGLLGSSTRFKQFVKSLSQRQTNQYSPLRSLVSPYILRRLKTDRSIIADLPDKTEMQTYCGLARGQAALYQNVVDGLAESLRAVEGMKRRGLVLSCLLRLKQICNHPSQFSGDNRYSPEASGKFARLAEVCEEIASRQEKMLVFTQFREIIEPLASFLTTLFGRPGLILHGGTQVGHRKKLVDQFQQEDGPPFFVLSLKAGGTGLNLTEAGHVVHFDRWWNPAVENQATDRAFRIGQRKNVLVHKFVCQGTVEEKIDALIKDKSALANDVLEAGADTLLTEMDNQALLEMVALDVNRVQV